MICIIDCGTSYINELKESIDELGCENRTISLNEINNNFKEFSGIIISGAPTILSQTDLEKYLQPFGFIKEVNIPVLGICLGHQIIGLLHDSKISVTDEIKKKENIEILSDDPLFNNIKSNSLFHEEHSEHVSLPKGFVLLAKSNTCDNESMKHPKKNIYGIQFHPEVSGDNGKKIFRNFINMCGK